MLKKKYLIMEMIVGVKYNLKIRYKEYENIKITADKIQLKRVIKNLLQN